MEPVPVKIKTAHFRSAKGKAVQNKKVKERKRLRDGKTEMEREEGVTVPHQQRRVRSSKIEKPSNQPIF